MIIEAIQIRINYMKAFLEDVKSAKTMDLGYDFFNKKNEIESSIQYLFDKSQYKYPLIYLMMSYYQLYIMQDFVKARKIIKKFADLKSKG